VARLDAPGPVDGGYARGVSAETATKSKAKRKKGPATVVRNYFEALDGHDIDAALKFWNPEGRECIVGLEELTIPDGFKRFFGELFDAMPDIRFEVLSVTSQKERAAVRWRAVGTFDGVGTFQGLRPNGARVEMEGFDLLTVEDELIVENLAYLNGAELARQLGALPPQGSAAERGMTAALNAKVAATQLVAKLRDR
jgi:predicted ester cyclase